MRAVDTNALVRLLVHDDARQYEAAKKFVAKGAWVTHLVLGETTWVLKALYLLSDAQILTAIEMLLNHTDITVQDADAVAAAVEIEKAAWQIARPFDDTHYYCEQPRIERLHAGFRQRETLGQRGGVDHRAIGRRLFDVRSGGRPGLRVNVCRFAPTAG